MHTDAHGNKIYTLSDIMRLVELGQFGTNGPMIAGIVKENVALQQENARLKSIIEELQKA